jgi:hypothetical protein
LCPFIIESGEKVKGRVLEAVEDGAGWVSGGGGGVMEECVGLLYRRRWAKCPMPPRRWLMVKGIMAVCWWLRVAMKSW